MAEIQLTAAQQAVEDNRGGSLLVSAAAGSGKTKVLVDRLFLYVTRDRCSVDDFLIITYTKAAAAELRGKIAAELNRRLAADPGNAHLRRQLLRVYRADIKTVDAFCTALLRENTHLLPKGDERHALTPDFRVLDEGDAALVRQRVLERTLEAFYDALDEAGAALADTLGAGRDDRALEALVLEIHEKLQSHAYPEQWLEKNLAAWSSLDGSFDDTPYAAALLTDIRRQAAHWAELLRRSAAGTAGDEALARGYGEKFQSSAETFDALAACGGWEEARRAADAVAFPRLTTPKGRKDEPEVVALKEVWEACKSQYKKLTKLLDISGEEAMEDLRAVAPAMEALLRLTGEFSRRYQAEKLRLNAADFSDQEHLALRLLVGEDGTPTELGQQVSQRYHGMDRTFSRWATSSRASTASAWQTPPSFWRSTPGSFPTSRLRPDRSARSFSPRISAPGGRSWTRPTSSFPISSRRIWAIWSTGRMRRCTSVRPIILPDRTVTRNSISSAPASVPERETAR